MLIKYNNHLLGYRYFSRTIDNYMLISILKPVEPTIVKDKHSSHFYRHLIYYDDSEEALYFNWNKNTFGISPLFKNEQFDYQYDLFKVGSQSYDRYNLKIENYSYNFYNLFMKIIKYMVKEFNYE